MAPAPVSLFPCLTKAATSPLATVRVLPTVTKALGLNIRTVGDMGAMPDSGTVTRRGGEMVAASPLFRDMAIHLFASGQVRSGSERRRKARLGEVDAGGRGSGGVGGPDPWRCGEHHRPQRPRTFHRPAHHGRLRALADPYTSVRQYDLGPASVGFDSDAAVAIGGPDSLPAMRRAIERAGGPCPGRRPVARREAASEVAVLPPGRNRLRCGHPNIQRGALPW